MNFEKNSNHIREITLSLGKYSALGFVQFKTYGKPFFVKKKKKFSARENQSLLLV